MSDLYNKSQGVASSHFLKISELKAYAQYQFSNAIDAKLIQSDQKKPFSDGGLGGIPLSSMRLENGKYVVFVDNTDSHTLIIGPTGTKKSRLVAMPTVRILGEANESMIISDPKAEIYYHAKDYLENKGYDVFVINLRNPQSGSSWNPLSIPYQFFKSGDLDRACEFANDIADNLAKTETKQESNADPFWDNSVGSLFFGLTMLMFKYCFEHDIPDEAVSIGNLIELRNELFYNENSARNKTRSPLWKYAKDDFIISSALGGTIVAPNDTFGSIMSVFNEKVTLFQIQPSLLNMLSYDDAIFSNIERKPTAIFLVLPDEKTTYHSLASLLIKQSYEYLIYKAQELSNDLPNEHSRVRVNYILDEFSSLPTISDFPAMITASRSRNIRFTIFVQSKHQLQLRYGKEAETIQANCTNWIFLSGRELSTLDEIEKLCGPQKASMPNIPLISITELQRLDKEMGEALILCGRHKPHIARLLDISIYEKGQRSVKKKPSLKVASNQSSKAALSSEWRRIKYQLEDKTDIAEYFGKNVDYDFSFPEQVASNGADKQDVDDLIRKIDAKIAELEREEQNASLKDIAGLVEETEEN